MTLQRAFCDQKGGGSKNWINDAANAAGYIRRLHAAVNERKPQNVIDY